MDKSVAGRKGQLKGGGLLRGRKERQSLETGCLASGVRGTQRGYSSKPLNITLLNVF